MKFIKEIKEGESLLGAFIGYKVMRYRGIDDQEITSLRISFNLYFYIIKIECIPTP